MQQYLELLETGIYETYKPVKTTTVGDILKELNLQGEALMGIIINGVKIDKTDLNRKLSPDDDIVVLPCIRGG